MFMKLELHPLNPSARKETFELLMPEIFAQIEDDVLMCLIGKGAGLVLNKVTLALSEVGTFS